MKVLVTGFEPFGSHSINPTSRLIDSLQRGDIAIPAHLSVTGVVLPVTFEGSFRELEKAMRDFDPEIVLCFGVAGGRSAIEFERVAINCIDADIADNAGKQPSDKSIEDSGSPAYFTNLPFRTMEMALKAAGIPSRVSNSAGTYVCNLVFYKLMEKLQGTEKQGGFIHVPPIEAISEEDLRRALAIILTCL